MSRKKKEDTTEKELSPRQQEIASLRGIPRGERTTGQSATLAQLLSEEKRERWGRLFPKRLRNMQKAIRNVLKLANVQSYEYTQEEADALAAAFSGYAAEIKRAFTGAPKERGLYDL